MRHPGHLFHTCTILSFSVDFPTPPSVITDSVVNLTVNNFNLSLTCTPNLNHMFYTWEKRNDSIPTTAQGRNTSHLMITYLKPEHSGDYRCTASNISGSITSSYTTVIIKGRLLALHVQLQVY